MFTVRRRGRLRNDLSWLNLRRRMQHAVILVVCLFIPWICQVLGQDEDDTALYPVVANVARKAAVTANATCGETRREFYCRLIQGEFFNPWESQYCYACDASSQRPDQRHPAENMVDGDEAWWQSPSLANGMEYDYVTVTIDLKQVYQVSYVHLQVALSPRPGNWILEKSVDGTTFTPWQYFAISDAECWLKYGTPPVVGRPKHLRDNQVICTSHFSRIDPLQNGTVFVSLVRGRATAFNPSQTLINFMSARYVRLRFQKMQKLNNDDIILMMNRPADVDGAILRRYFYTIKEVSVGAQCECHGHANSCTEDPMSGEPLCACEHNTCGPTCNMCCPKYNQKPWQPGNQNFVCEECNCNGHATECTYNETVASRRLSNDINNMKIGGGVCLNCQGGTEGVNCERCIMGYYRPLGSPLSAPCQPCQCNQIGSTGVCMPDDSLMDEGLMPGDCVCQEEYAGSLCDRCAPGYRDYPWCQRCPCDPAGSLNSDPCGQCICKENVEGSECDRCALGHYNLRADNPEGCSPCFCFGATSQCESLDWGKAMLSELKGWTLSTLSGSHSYMYVPVEESDWLVYRGPPLYGMEEEPLYWNAPVSYLGDKLYSYGGVLEYTFQYLADTTDGRYLADADLILQGEDLKVAKRGKFYRENLENVIEVEFNEFDWFSEDRAGYFSRPITKADFMSVLINLRRFLIRASYHTGQILSQLTSVKLEVAMETELSDEPMGSVEKCLCPPGYKGMSCESCEDGYRRLNNTLMGGKCERCRCFGHSMSCDPVNGKCLECEDNTVGDNCELCRGGFYGDPTVGEGDWCKPCACPLVEAANNFAQDCMLRDDDTGYVCVSCQTGHVGLHCEHCADGYFGVPVAPGNFCQPCQCNNNIDLQAVGNCDTRTGECLKCLNNTEGYGCDRCKIGYFGKAVNGDCRECQCDVLGSENSGCDHVTGHCDCKPHFTGQYCDHCEAGFGNMKAGCLPCNCSSEGAYHQVCDPVTGQCDCKPGITSLSCHTCQPGYFGLSTYGCTECDCDPVGRNSSLTCDLISGQCHCLPNVRGQRCDECEVGFWNMSADVGCMACNCDDQGSWDRSCDPLTGQCNCKPGVEGLTCSSCQEGYYGLSYKGCRECDRCKSQHHVCDRKTGACVCPPHTEGDQCERCTQAAWGHHPTRGCQACECDKSGSVSLQCDRSTGQCVCKPDYTGQRCDQCQFGYYGFPKCQACLCNINGTSQDDCDGRDWCQCDETGQCPCKTNVEGRRCDRCKPGHFGLRSETADGCFQCFCFGKSELCTHVNYTWGKVYGPERHVNLNGRSPTSVDKVSGLNIIPLGESEVSVPPGEILSPVYWSLPAQFVGDKILVYSGHLEFRILYETPVPETYGSADWDDDTNVFSGVVAVLRSRGIVLQHQRSIRLQPNIDNDLVVTLTESEWTSLEPASVNVTKALMLAVLANLETVHILSAPTAYNYYVQLRSVTLEVAGEGSPDELSPLAVGVEQCQCPPLYSGSSCQLPGSGYYRDQANLVIDWSDVSNLTIPMKSCDCNEHSQTCDPYTGECKDCSHNTLGRNCERCVDGYYGYGPTDQADFCQICACPMKILSNNFSPTCRPYGEDHVCTNCTQGTTGMHCERCMPGYYGDPTVGGDRCKPCACNLMGSRRRSCDKVTGQCDCRPGLSGRSCDQCRPRHVLIGGRCRSCEGGCPGILMSDLDEVDVNMTRLLNLNITDLPLPFYRAEQILNNTRRLEEKLSAVGRPELEPLRELLREAQDNVTALVEWTKQSILESQTESNNSVILSQEALDMETGLNELFDDLQENVGSLDELVEKLLLNGSGLNISTALPHARQILIEIRVKVFKRFHKSVDRELGYAKDTRNKVNELERSEFNMSALDMKLTALQSQLTDLRSMLNESTRTLLDSQEVYLSNGKLYNVSELLAGWIQANLTDLNTIIEEGQFHVEEGKQLLAEAVNNLESCEKKLDILRAISERLDVQGEVMRAGLARSEELVKEAWGHALRLLEKALNLNSTFSGARAEAVDPLQATTVYENILLAVDRARQAAKEAVREAEHTLAMAKNETLQRQVDESVSVSKNLANESDEIGRNILGQRNQHGRVSEGLIPLERNLNQSEEDWLLIDRHSSGLGEGFEERLDAIDKLLPSVVEASGNLSVLAEERTAQIASEIVPKVLQVHPEAVLKELGYTVNETVDRSRTHLLRMENLTDWLNTKLHNITHLKSHLDSKILALRDKINLARDEANNVKAALSAAGKCVRSFRAPDHSSTTNSVSLHFKTNSTQQDMLLFLLQNSPSEYLSLELREGKLVLSWNVGGGPGRVIHPEPIEDSFDNNRGSERWYRVEANRVGRLGLLKVVRLFGLPPLEEVELSGTSPPGSSRLSFNNASNLFVAGVADSQQVPEGVTRQNFSGCIGEVILERRRIGLFNFLQTSESCAACLIPPSLVAPATGVYQFDGTGYAAMPGFQPYSSTRYVVSLEFKTVWENSLLLLSANLQTGDYLSLELRDGRLSFQFYLGSNSLGILSSKRKYNNNKWVSVTAGRQNLQGLLEVSVKGEPDEEEVIEGLALPGNSGLELLDQTLYFGGLPDSVQLPRAPYISRKKRGLSKREVMRGGEVIDVELSPFRGCMRDVQVGSKRLSPLDLLEGDSVGVSPGCTLQGERVVGLLGEGFVELPGHSLSKGLADVSVTFITSHPEGVILLAIGENDQHFYSVALVNGLLQARVSGGSGVVVLTAERNYTDGQPHSVSIIKIDRNVELLVDDSRVESGELPMGTGEIRIPRGSGLFIGGVPSGVNTRGKVATSKGLHGCISDVIINKGLLLLDEPVSFERADIGRCSDAALTSIFGPSLVTRRPSVWPGLATSKPHVTGVRTTPFPGSPELFPPTREGADVGSTPLPTYTTTPSGGGVIPDVSGSSWRPTEQPSLQSTQRFVVSSSENTSKPPWVTDTSPTTTKRPDPTDFIPPWLTSEKPATTVSSNETRSTSRTSGVFPPWVITTQYTLYPSQTTAGSGKTRTTSDRGLLPPWMSSSSSPQTGGTVTSGTQRVQTQPPSVQSSTTTTSSSGILPPWVTTPEYTSTLLTSTSGLLTSVGPPLVTDIQPTSKKSRPDEEMGVTSTRSSISPGSSERAPATPSSEGPPLIPLTSSTGTLGESEDSTASTDPYRPRSTTTDDFGVIPPVVGETTTTESSLSGRSRTTTTIVPGERVTSPKVSSTIRQEDNETLVVIPGGEENGRTQKAQVTTTTTQRSSTLVDVVPIQPETARPPESGVESPYPTQSTSRGPSTTPTPQGPLASSVSVSSSSVPPVLEATISGSVTPSERLTTPSIVTATISVSPAVTETTTSSQVIPSGSSTTTQRYVVVPTAEYSTQSTKQPDLIPSVTAIRVSDESTTVITTTTAVLRTSTPPPTSCAEGEEYANEEDSMSFGNGRYSFVEIKIRQKAVRKNFTITYDFRTFYSNGMFFYLTNDDQTHFVAAQLKDGRVVVTYNNQEGTPLTITTSEQYIDGKWHSVHIEKGQREISLEVDGGAILRAGIPRRLEVTAPMYVGGLPKDYNIREGLVTHSVRGCMRSFRMNGELFRLTNASVASGVGPCYSGVEKGAYFSGYSYGVFAQEFNVGRATLILLSFRTHRTDGVLLTVSSYQGSPALTLELHKGKLKFSMRSSAGVFTAESRYDTEFALCDQRWHHVKAEVIQSVITLRVDDKDVAYAFDRAPSRRRKSKFPLFIGGFPDYARPQGASFSLTNFVGCMKNVFINGIQVDWFNLVQSVEINKVSCPVL